MSSQTPGGGQPQATSQEDDFPMSGETLKKMMKCIQQSSYLEISSEFQLPKIYAVGSQSTGKSSVIEALSGIQLPRGTGTCTRCPIEINLLKNEGADGGWTCKICLVKNYRYDPTVVPDDDDKPIFWPWLKQELHKSPFALTNRKDDVCDLIGRAQSAILNPSHAAAEYQPPSPRPHRLNQFDFSPNTVQLNISGPNYCSLTFFDLPGVISVEENAANDHHVKLVENLVKEHIQAKNSVILLTLPMDQDLHVQQAFRVIRDLRAERRTLGVLTKPDLTRDLKTWQGRMLNSSSSMLGHGFHVVMLETMPGGEAGFFEQPDWTTINARVRGVDALARRLEQLLQERFCGSLPDITRRLVEMLAEAETQLNQPSDVQLPGLLGVRLVKLDQKLREMFCVGDQNSEHFRNKWSKLADQFKAALGTSAPSFNLATPANQRRTGGAQTSQFPAPHQPRREQRKHLSNSSAEDAANAVRSLNIQRTAKSTKAPFGDYARPRKTFNLTKVREGNAFMNDARCRGDVAPRAVDQLNEQSVSHWNKPTEEFVKRTGEMVNEGIVQVLTSVFDEFSKTKLFAESKTRVKVFLRKIVTEQQERAKESYKIELDYLQTRDQRRFDDEEQKAFDELLKLRAEILEEEDPAGKDRPKKRKLANANAKDDTKEQRDEYSLELRIMAKVRAYYRIASSRFVDNLCGSIQANMFPKCQKDLTTDLRRILGSDTDSDEARANIINKMSSTAQQARTREYWQHHQEELRNMRASFEEFNLGGSPRGGWAEGEDDDEDMQDL